MSIRGHYSGYRKKLGLFLQIPTNSSDSDSDLTKSKTPNDFHSTFQ